MAIQLKINGELYLFPEPNDNDWGADVTNWANAITVSTIHKEGGNVEILNDLDLGSMAGIISKYFKSRSPAIAEGGVLRLSNTDTINFRNGANTEDLVISIEDDKLMINGQSVGYRFLYELEDVELIAPKDRDFVSYKDGLWTNSQVELNDLDTVNVDINTGVDGQVLRFDGTEWKNELLDLSDIDKVTIDDPTLAKGQKLAYDGSKWTNKFTELDELYDVELSDLFEGQVFAYVDGKWVNKYFLLNDLNDVLITGAVEGNSLYHNGDSWVNKTLNVADIGDVELLNTAEKDVLSFDGTDWVNRAITIDDFIKSNNPQEGQSLIHDGLEWTNKDTELNNNKDVEIDTPLLDEVLTFDGTNWVNKELQVVTSLDDLTDTDLSTAIEGDTLVLENGKWIGKRVNLVTSLVDLSDTDITTVEAGDVLTFDGFKWVAKETYTGEIITSLEDLTDTTLTTPVEGDVLGFDGTKWVNKLGNGDVFEITKDGMGFDNDNTLLVFECANNSGSFPVPNTTVTIKAKTGNEWSYLFRGKRIKMDAPLVYILTPSDYDTGFFLNLTEDGTFVNKAKEPDMKNTVMCAYVHYSSVKNCFLLEGDHRHKADRDTTWHQTKDLEDGLTIRNLGILDWTNDDPAKVGLQLTDTTIVDEDLVFLISNGGIGFPFKQPLQGSITEVEIPCIYTGVGGLLEASNSSKVFWTEHSLKYNNVTTGAKIDVTNNKYVNYFLVATNCQKYPIKLVMGRAEFDSVVEAVDEKLDTQSLFPEVAMLYRIVIRRDNSVSQIGKCRLVASQAAANKNIFESLAGLEGNTLGDHITLLGRDLPNQHPIESITGLADRLSFIQANAVSDWSEIKNKPRTATEHPTWEDIIDKPDLRPEDANTGSGGGTGEIWVDDSTNGSGTEGKNDIFDDGSILETWTLDYTLTSLTGNTATIQTGVVDYGNGAVNNGIYSATGNSATAEVPALATSNAISLSFFHIAENMNQTLFFNMSKFTLFRYGGSPYFTYSNGTQDVVTSIPFVVGELYHVVYTYDNYVGKIYLNGELIVTASAQKPTSTFWLFGYSPSSIHYFRGTQDQIRLFNRVITPEEITILSRESAQGASRLNTLNADPFGDGKCIDTWSFDSNLRSLKGNFARRVGTARPDFVASPLGGGISTNNVSIKANIPEIYNLTQIGYSTWIKPSSTPTTFYRIMTGNIHGLYLRSTGLANGFYIGNGINETYINKVINLDEWHHVVHTTDGIYQRIYIDGVLVASPYAAIKINSTIITLCNDDRETPFESGVAVYDQTRIFSRGLSLGEVTKLYKELSPDIRAKSPTEGGECCPLTTINWDNVLDKPFAFTPNTHGHHWSEITGKPASLTRPPSWNDLTDIPPLSGSWNDLTDKPLTFAPTTHKHPWSDLTGIPVTASRFPTWTEVTAKPTLFAPTAHTHPWTQLTGIPVTASRFPTWNEVTGKPTTFPSSGGTASAVAWNNVTGKPVTATRFATWNEVSGKPTTFTPATHNHPWGQITGIPVTASRFPTWNEVTSKPLTFAPTEHTHDYSTITNRPAVNAGAVGSYYLGQALSGTGRLADDLVYGSNFRASSAGGIYGNDFAVGTWRVMGSYHYGTTALDSKAVTLFYRVV